jgi:hypothetical protein
MCNAWNHSPGCQCGWGGDGHLGRRTTGNSYSSWGIDAILRDYGGQAARERVYTDSYVNPNARCPVCGAQVFFYQSPYGGRVYFDELGRPWPKHPCTDNSQYSRPLTSSDSRSLDYLYNRLLMLNMPTRHTTSTPNWQQPIVAAPAQPKAVDEVTFARLMEQGEAAQRLGDLARAAILFAEAINENYRSTQAWLALAKVLTDRHERAYCLTKVLRTATAQDRIDIHAVEDELTNLKAGQLKHPSVLWPAKPPEPLTQRTRPAKPVQPAPRPPKDIATWSLIVRIAKGGHHVLWLLLASGRRGKGEVQIAGKASTAMLQAILAGLREAVRLVGTAQAQIAVISNDESVIKQLRGEAKIKQEQDRELLKAIHSIRPRGGQLTFMVKPTRDIEKYF